MSDSKKPKLSEIKARDENMQGEESLSEFIFHARTDIPYLLDLVKRLGKALGWTLANLNYLEEPSQRDDEGCITHMRCRICKAETRWNYPDVTHIPHTVECEHRKARALLLEVKE